MIVGGARALLIPSRMRFAAATAPRKRHPRKKKATAGSVELAEVEAIREAEADPPKQAAYQVMSEELRQRVEAAFVAEGKMNDHQGSPVHFSQSSEG